MNQIIFKFEQKKLLNPTKTHCTWYMFDNKYLKDETSWIVTSVIIRDKLDELYIVKE